MFSQPVAAKIVGDRLSPRGQKQILKLYKDALRTSEQLIWIEKRIRSNGHWLSDDPAVREFDLQFYALYASCRWELEDPHSAAFLENPKAAKLAKEKGLKTEKLGPARTPEAKLAELAEAYGGRQVGMSPNFEATYGGSPSDQLKGIRDAFMAQYHRNLEVPAEGFQIGSIRIHPNNAPSMSEFPGIDSAAEDGNRTTVWYHGKTYQKQSTNQSTEETIMKVTASLNIRTIQFIGNNPADQYTDEQIYSLIAEREAAIKHFEAMTNRPERLKVSLTTVQKEIDDLVKIVDARV